MWKIWIIFSVFKLSFSAPVDSKEDSAPVPTPAGDSQALSSLFMPSPFALCDDIKRYGNKIPKRLQKLYVSMRNSIAEGSHDFALDSNSMHMLPSTLLYVLPRIRLHNMTGLAAAEIIRRTPDDEALAIKLLSLLTSEEDKRAFLEALPYDGDPESDEPGIHLSAGVENEIGRSMASWYQAGAAWHYWQFDAAVSSGSPILAHLPTHFVNRIAPQTASKFLFHLKSWRVDSPDSSAIWERHSQRIKRMWTITALQKWERPSLWFPVVARDAGYLFLGATPEEIETIVSFVSYPRHLAMLMDVNFKQLQSRTLYDIIRKNYTENADVKFVRNLLPNLLPRQIQPFDPASVDVHRYYPTGVPSSLPTQKQILEQHIAYLINEGILQNPNPASWKEEISKLEMLVHLLPSSSLEVFKDQQFSHLTLSKIFSKSLSFRQSRYLTKNGNLLSFKDEASIMSGKHHLKALSSHELALHKGSMIPEHVQHHLLRHIPGQSRALTAVLLEKVYLDIDDRSLLRSILENDDYQLIMKLISNREVSYRFRNFVDSLLAISQESEELAFRVRRLPSNIGNVLLAEFRKDIVKSEDGWTLDNLILNPKSPLLRLLISHLQCADINLINVVDIVPVLGYYVRERSQLGLTFPKNLQYCSQKAVIRFLKLKSAFQCYADESRGLLSFMEGFEVKAVGGYILSSLPVNFIEPSYLKIQMLREIGSLSLPEILSATSLENLHTFADSFAEMFPNFHLREVSDLGNLVWYLNPDNVRRLPSNDFKLMMEMKETNEPRAPCFTTAERELWREYVMQVVGKPNTWTSSTLALLGDLLYVFDETDFGLIPANSRVEAADILSNQTSFHPMIEWTGKLSPIPYHMACYETLPADDRLSYKAAVRSLLRFYLESSQMALNTVINANGLLKIDDQINAINVESDLSELTTSESTAAPSQSTTESFDRIKRSVQVKRIAKRVLKQDGNMQKDEINEISRDHKVIEVEMENETARIHVTESFTKKNLVITCDAIRMLGLSSSFVVDEDDFKSWSRNELEDCAEVLGSLDLPVKVRKSVWTRLSKWKENQNLLEVGNLVSVIEEEDVNFLQLDIKKPWALETLAVLSEHVTIQTSLNLIADRFLVVNQDIPSLEFGVAAALGRIICTMSKKTQQKLLMSHPHVFSQVIPLLGDAIEDTYCFENLVDFAKLTLGPPKTWTTEDIASLGVIASGLTVDDWKHSGMNIDAISGLTPKAVSLIKPEVFKELSEEQLSRLPPLSVAAISPAQSSSLSPSQSAVLERVRRQTPEDLNIPNGGLKLHAFGTTMLVLLATVVKALV